MKKAVITGITGQDGAYLSQLLLDKSYTVYGTYRRTSHLDFWRLKELGIRDHPRLHLIPYDLTDFGNTMRILESVQPDEIYNLAAQSFVGVSFEQPETTAQITGLGALRLLEAMRLVAPKARFYQASTSEMFGSIDISPQNEGTPFHPRSPYGVAKLYAHWITINYRESYDLFACSGILFNHESPLRGREFVTRKITATLALIRSGKDICLELGNLNARRDWGYAKEYVQGIWQILQQDKPGTYVLGTGQTHTVRDFVTLAADVLGMETVWEGSGIDEICVDRRTGQTLVRINPAYYRPADVDLLCADPRLAEKELGWKAHTTLQELCALMVEADVRRLQEGKT